MTGSDDLRANARHLHQLPPGTVLRERYQIEEVLGEGGFGITYRALDRVLLLPVAVKEYFPGGLATRNTTVSGQVDILSDDLSPDYEKGMRDFLREARTLARFQEEPGIVSVRDFFEENRTAYIIMEYVDGTDLKTCLGRRPAYSIGEACALLDPVMAALEKVHSAGIIHRDISPSNILIRGDGQAVLLDFGAARSINSRGDLTLSVVLKPGYSPEEQYRTRGQQGPWTDVYALCATIYRMITGAQPEDALQRLLLDELCPPSALGTPIPAAAESALMKGLSLRAEDRYQTVGELRDALEASLRAPKRRADRPAAEMPAEGEKCTGLPADGTEVPLKQSGLSDERLPLTAWLPAAGLLCLFEMARRTGRKAYAQAGTVFALPAGAVLAYICLVSLLYFFLPDSRQVVLPGWILLPFPLLYLARGIYVLLCRRDYLRFRRAVLEEERKGGDAAADTAADRPEVWRHWVLLGYVPFLHCFSTLRMSRVCGQKGGTAAGIVSAGSLFLTIFVGLDALCARMLVSGHVSNVALRRSAIGTVCLLVLGILHILHLFRMVLLREEFRKRCNAEAEQLRREHPLLSDPAWRKENSRWRVWTWLPVTGGIGLLLASRASGDRRLAVRGAISLVLSLFSAALVLAALVRGEFPVDVQEYWIYLRQPLAAFVPVLLWLLVLYDAYARMEEIFAGISRRLGGFYSFADKEIYEKRAGTDS